MNIKKHLHLHPLAVRSISVICAVFLIYLLSVGPSYRALRTGRMKWPTFHAIYGPIKGVSETGDWNDDSPWRRGLDWYEGLWYDEGAEIGNAIKAQLASNGIYTVEEASK